MKLPLTALVVALSLVVSPTLAQNVDMSTLTPVLTYPDPAPEPATKDASGIDK